MLIGLLTVLILIKNSLVQLRKRRGHRNTSNLRDTKLTTLIQNRTTSKYKQKSKKQSKLLTNFNSAEKQQQDIIMSTTATVTVTTPGDDKIDGTPSASVIKFQPGDNQCCYEITERDVKIIGSPGTHDHGSSKVKLKNIVDYKWEVKNYPGHLIAVHIDGKHIAYVINVNNKASRTEGMIRVVNAQSGLRALIKGMSGEVLDLQFAHIEKDHVLGSIDQNSLYVHKIDMHESTLVCNLVIKVEDPLANYTPKYDKISWCPYIDIPGEEDDEDSQLIVWARGSMFQCFNVNVIVNEYGFGQMQPNSLSVGYLKYHDEQMVITWVALSPDGSTLSVASTDGVIRFFQVYMHDKDPRCLHQWKPHEGKQVSSCFFLDNVTSNVADTYWKYAITAAVNNTEFKVWDCGTWACLQTVTFSTANEDQNKLHIIAEMDRTSSYLVLSSLETRTCYVLQIVKDSPSLAKDSDSDGPGNSLKEALNNTGGHGSANLKLKHSQSKLNVYIKSVSEFPLNSGILSFSIVDAAVSRYKCANDNYLCEEIDEYDEETNSINCVVVRMFIVQSKSMQECRIMYQPTVAESTDDKSAMNCTSEDSPTNSLNDITLMEGTNNYHNNTNNGQHANGAADTPDDADGDGDVDIDDEEDDDDVDEDEEDDDDDENTYIPTDINTYQDEVKSEKTPLEALLSIGAGNGVSNQITIQTTTTSSSSVVAVAAAAAMAPSAVLAEKTESRTASPQVATAGKGFGPVNLMTPDAFSSTTNERKTPENVSSEVLNAILMLASVTGQTAPANKPDAMNLLNFVNNKVIEDQEHQKLQMKQALEVEKKFIAIDNNPARENMTSAGSSPSREVQEIMSLQDYDKSSFSGDEFLLEEPSSVDMADSKVSAPLDDSVTELDSSSSNVIVSNSLSAKTWPNVPDLHKVTTTAKHSAELQNAANVMSQAVSATSGLNNSHVPPNLHSSSSSSITGGICNAPNTATKSNLPDINMKLNQLLDLVQVQTMQINSLQEEIREMKKANPLTTAKSMSEFSFKLEMQLSKLMEQYLKRFENDHKKKLNAFMAGRDAQNRGLRDGIMQMINQYALTQFSEVVSKVITIEIQRQLAPMLMAKIDHLQQQIQMDVAQKLAAFDIMVKENIAQVCKSKQIIDAFGKSVLVGVQGSLQSAFIESMSSTLIPAYEKSSQNMFKQLHDAFSVGIKEFMEQFDNYLQLLQPVRESSEELLNKFLGFRQYLDAALVKHRASVNETMLETRKDVKSLEILLGRQIQELLRIEMRKCFETQTVALRSQANTPAPMYDAKETIKHLLLQGQINKAFHQALLANDLNLVEYTLKNADQNAVFTPDCCCLEQKVLLSLIQQISADMSNHNEVKQNYLAEALLAIDVLDPITREHAPKVLQDLFRNCQMFLLSYPKSPQCSNVRMLMKAVQGYKDKF